jgi:hypothetical protein
MTSSAKKECYALIQQIAVLQDPICVICGKPSDCGHHLFKRDRLATAFLPEAVRGVCNETHRVAHAEPEWFQGFMIRSMGDERYFELSRLSRTVVPYMDFKATRDQLRLILFDLQRKMS